MSEEVKFKLVAPFKPMGDQPEAIRSLTEGVNRGLPVQVLLGVTGSGKTFTMANIIAQVNRPTLILAHNKTLVGQLYSELKEFFPENAVEYFVSYYDYYQPEAYIAATDTYIEKDSAVNDEIDRMRHSATNSLMTRRDVIVVASVSCIYGLGSPETYKEMMLHLRPGMELEQNGLLKKLVAMQYERNDIDFKRGTFRVRGDSVEIIPSSEKEHAIRVEFFGDEIDRISDFNPVTGELYGRRTYVGLWPATHYAASAERLEMLYTGAKAEMEQQRDAFEAKQKYIEAQRIQERVTYDMEMIRELGYCSGIENYSGYLDGRQPGEAPYTLLDYFPEDFMLFVDESHTTLPQVRAMYNGDRNRKENLINYGFRLPSALDNRPLRFEEFNQRIHQMICFSATPGSYELGLSQNTAEQLIRPTGLLDPKIELRPVEGQIDHLFGEINACVAKGERVLVTTLTKRMAEALSDYYKKLGIKVAYLHSDVDTMERMEILRDLRLGKYDVLVGINLLREGLDLPEVSLVAILDADKEGFLRSETSMVQTMGRAARNVNGRVILYADVMTGSMQRAIDETNRRRCIQEAYNVAHGIVPKSIRKAVAAPMQTTFIEEAEAIPTAEALRAELALIEEDMRKAARNLDFEAAAKLRDRLFDRQDLLKKLEGGEAVSPEVQPRSKEQKPHTPKKRTNR